MSAGISCSVRVLTCSGTCGSGELLLLFIRIPPGDRLSPLPHALVTCRQVVAVWVFARVRVRCQPANLASDACRKQISLGGDDAMCFAQRTLHLLGMSK
jgi:hypothetical protein